MLPITSPQNPRVKDAVRLRDRRHREKQGRIPIDGARELQRAIRAGVKLVEVFVCEPLCQGDDDAAAVGVASRERLRNASGRSTGVRETGVRPTGGGGAGGGRNAPADAGIH